MAFVAQRCGVEVNGGSEALCLQVADRLSGRWETEVLTTCARDNYMTWEDQYSPGEEQVRGTRIRRFSVDYPRHVETFNRLSEGLAGRISRATLAEQEEWMRAQGPMCSGLGSFIQTYKGAYQAFLFFPYLYATTYFWLPLVQEKAFLVPAGHDEWPIHLSMWDAFFKRPRGFMFLTPEEKAFLQRRFSSSHLNGPISGIGIDLPRAADPDRFRQTYGIQEDFLLYMGRIDPSKGCEDLFRLFVDYRRWGAGPDLKLVLLGKPAMPVPDHPDILALGYVDEQTKLDALAACRWLVNPSPFESLSIVLLEAWSVGTPVLVTEKAEVLVGQCRRSQGGLWYRDGAEFGHILSQVGKDARSILGEQGRCYVTENYAWDHIIEKYVMLVEGNER